MTELRDKRAEIEILKPEQLAIKPKSSKQDRVVL